MPADSSVGRGSHEYRLGWQQPQVMAWRRLLSMHGLHFGAVRLCLCLRRRCSCRRGSEVLTVLTCCMKSVLRTHKGLQLLHSHDL